MDSIKLLIILFVGHLLYYSCIDGPVVYYGISSLTGIPFNYKRSLLRLLPISIFSALCNLLANVSIDGVILFTEETYVMNLTFDYITSFLFVFLLFRWHKPKLKLLLTASFIITLIRQLVHQVVLLFPINFTDNLADVYSLEFIFRLLLTYSLLWFLTASISLLLSRLLKRIKFGSILEYYISIKNISNFFVALCLTFPALLYFVQYLTTTAVTLVYPLTAILLLIVQLASIYYLGSNAMRREKISNLEVSAIQQQFYTQQLEKIQKDLRIFQHDFRNRLSRVYLQMNQGDLEAVTHFMQTTLFDFDSEITQKIKEIAPLNEIAIIELKSLLYTKIFTMNQKAIAYKLEILRPLTAISMDINDFCTCVGILIDNAIEESENLEDSYVLILISRLEDCVTLVVENRVKKPVLVQRIWDYDYSTKGNNRGIGLFSYRSIVQKYKNVSFLAQELEGKFRQELKVSDLLL